MCRILAVGAAGVLCGASPRSFFLYAPYFLAIFLAHEAVFFTKYRTRVGVREVIAIYFACIDGIAIAQLRYGKSDIKGVYRGTRPKCYSPHGDDKGQCRKFVWRLHVS